MAGASLLTLLDDIASILDDVSVMTKVAAKKTAGVLGDDLALNAQQVIGVRADRELPIVWAVAKGSLVNKAILVPAALATSIFAPILVFPLMMIGGAYLCFEGIEKIFHKFSRHLPEETQQHEKENNSADKPAPNDVDHERVKIRGAIRTDFILSAEIIVISLGAVAHAPWSQQVVVLVAIALLMTVGVYGLVAGIVKLDDFGLYLIQKTNIVLIKIGRGLLVCMPYLLKTLAIVGTLAMFLVGGGIVVHGIAPIANIGETAASMIGGGFFGSLAKLLWSLIVGVMLGAAVFGTISVFLWFKNRIFHNRPQQPL